MKDFDFTASVARADGKTFVTRPFATERGARNAALRLLRGVGGQFNLSYKIGDGWNRNLVCGGESATVSANGTVRH